MPRVYEREIDRVIVDNLNRNTQFRDWFIRKFTKLPVFPYRLLEARRSLRDRELGETDIFLKIETLNSDWDSIVNEKHWHYKYCCGTACERTSSLRSTIAFLIENKITAGQQAEQPERYRERGSKGIYQNRWGYFRTGLIAPKSYLDFTTAEYVSYPRPRWARVRDASFEHVIYYETLIQKFVEYDMAVDDITAIATAISQSNEVFEQLWKQEGGNPFT